MSDSEKVKLSDLALLKEKQFAREVVNEIRKTGPTDKVLQAIISELALDLESSELTREIREIIQRAGSIEFQRVTDDEKSDAGDSQGALVY
jgi:FKBP-type peptidyl-prolyl cis-trans isomerase (trigger factor)